MLYPEKYNSRSQDLEEMYHDAGQFYWGKSDAWLKQRNLFSKHSSPYVLPRYRVQDIDTKEDWRKAELMHLALL
jgi:N-acylneuraminate cytidylyltransferase